MEWWEWILLVFVVLYGIGWGLHFSGALDEIAKAKKGKEMKAKDRYKVGDKVRIVDKWGPGSINHSKGLMDHWLGKVMTIRSFDADGDARMEEDAHENYGRGWYWNDAMIAGLAGSEEKLTPLKIVITTDGKTTLARYYEGKKVVHTAEAICNGDDTFDFGTGAKLATERLLEKMKPKFKVGDIVKIIGNKRENGVKYHYLLVGGLAQVTAVYGTEIVAVGLSDHWNSARQIIQQDHVELVETK